MVAGQAGEERGRGEGIAFTNEKPYDKVFPEWVESDHREGTIRKHDAVKGRLVVKGKQWRA